MSYTALYRKFRPLSFEDVKGQDHIVTTLRNQIKADRIGHAYLFSGTRGTGKTTIAKIFARAVNCENPVDGSPCGECATCKAIATGASMNVIEIDAASNNGVDNIREIIDEVSYSPTAGKYKVYIIDEVHMLSTGAFNALLKTLEEPPSYVIFILATTEVHKIPVTILSRCQRYDFKRISIDTISERLKELMVTEQVPVEEKAIRYIAKAGDGSMRDALSLLDQCIAFHLGKELTYDMVLDVLGAIDTEVFSRLLRMVIERNVVGCIELLEELVIQGRELGQFVQDFAWYLRNLLLIKSSDEADEAGMEEIINVSTENLTRLKEEAKLTDPETIMRYIRIFSELSGQLRYASMKRILVEMTLIKLCKPEMETNQDALIGRIHSLEEKVENGVAVTQVYTSQPGKETISGPIKKAVLQKAVPQEVQEIVRSWQMIKGAVPQPVKSYLKTATLSMDNENRLLIVLDEENYYYLNTPDHIQMIQDTIGEIKNREVEVVLKKVADERERVEGFPNLEELIQMDVEIEDE